MKFISSILFILIFSLSIIPCSDPYLSTKNIADIEHHHDHNNDDHDSCTPLCVCACCGMTFTVQYAQDLSLYKDLSYFSNSFDFSHNYHFDFYESVWHPPST